MSRFFLGDELGNIKTLRYSPHSQDSKCNVTTIRRDELSSNPANGVQYLSTPIQDAGGKTILAAAFSSGSCILIVVNDDDSHRTVMQWKEPRIVTNKFIGMSISESSVYTCTSNGMLRRTPFSLENPETGAETSDYQSATIPSRLRDWRLSEDGESFAYGGDEVDLSVWKTELAFQSDQVLLDSSVLSKKRKRNANLFPAEIWRARNVPNDNLGLRQPTRITALTYLPPSSSNHHLITGTQFGDIRRYDTRASRRPVSNWIGVAKVGGVKSMEKGISEHELFVGDNGSSLYSIDTRTGGVLYGYKGLSGAVTSIAQSHTIMVSVALDRYARIHSVFAPPTQARTHQDRKGEVLEKSYLTSLPTTVVWDKSMRAGSLKGQYDDDDVWENMKHVN